MLILPKSPAASPFINKPSPVGCTGINIMNEYIPKFTEGGHMDGAVPLKTYEERFGKMDKAEQLERIAMAQIVSEEEVVGHAVIVMDKPKPEVFGTEWLKWWHEAEAKLKVLKAKALIKHLNNDN